MMRNQLLKAALFVSFSVWAAVPSWAQVAGRILVKVVDEQNGVMPGVTVTIASSQIVAGEATNVTDASGTISFPSLSPGTYTVKAELGGFQTLFRQGIIVAVGQTTPLTMMLNVAALAETITVSGRSPTVDTTSARVNVTIDQDLLQSTPGGHNIYGLSEYKVPGLVTRRPDVGGAEGGLQVGLSARGTPTSQTTMYLNGINVTDGGFAGATQYYYDYETFDEVEVATGALDLSVPSSGVFVNMVTKSGGDRWNGQASFSRESDSTQGRNVDQALKNFGLAPNAGAVDFISNGSLQGGGPLVARKLRIFASLRDWRVHRRLPGFPEVESTDIFNLLGNVTWQLNPSHKLTGFAGRNYYDKPNRGASALFEPVSVNNEQDVMSVYQGAWNWVLGNKAFLDAKASYGYMFFPLYAKSQDQTLFDQATSFRSRMAASETQNHNKRYQQKVDFTYYIDEMLRGRHELRVGVDHGHVPYSRYVFRNGDVDLSWNSTTRRATEVTLYNTPVLSENNVNTTALYAQDTFTLDRVTIAGGVRWERYEAYFPAQTSPPSQWFPSIQRTFAEINNVISWQTLGPRVNIVWNVTGTGKTAVKAALARYYYAVGANDVRVVNPNSEVFERRAWNDLNGDLRFQPGEAGGLLAVGGAVNTAFDPDIKRPYTDEMVFILDRELISNLRLSSTFIYRNERDHYGSFNRGIPASAFSPVTVTDLGRDGNRGTEDDNPSFTVYNQDRTTLGQDRFFLTNSDQFNSQFRGVEFTATKRLSNRWQMLAGYTVGKAKEFALLTANGVGSIGSPNDLINVTGPSDQDVKQMFKLTGTYQLPAGFLASGNFRSQTGKPVTRQARFALDQGSVLVNVEPRGNARTDRLTTTDLRLTKSFRLGADRKLNFFLDAYNVFNANTTWEVRTLTGRLSVREGGDPNGQLFNQQQFLSPTSILGPRIFQFGALVTF